ncbi:hypothetical protein [Microbacterium sp. S16(2024)]|uniref:hypothetical protein n=1 Tax=Microbacterium sp. S16(2024) TaxID=3368601 RepID=UPI00373F1108
MSTHHENDPDYNGAERASDAVKSTTAHISETISAVANEARAAVTTGVDKVRDAYEHNPTRTITLGILAFAGLLALITTLTRRN